MSGYLRSFLLQYLEEALAETIAPLRVYGFSGFMTGIRFPLGNGYLSINGASLTLSSMVNEGFAIGTITVGADVFSVQFVSGVRGESLVCYATDALVCR